MASKYKYTSGTFFKKVLEKGVAAPKFIAFLPKTLAKLVHMDNGKTVQESITTLEDRPEPKIFTTKAAYNTAKKNGTIKSDDVVIVTDPTALTLKADGTIA